MRVSVVGWQTTADDIDRSAEAILAAARDVGGRPSEGRDMELGGLEPPIS
jgi:hypothetical protein